MAIYLTVSKLANEVKISVKFCHQTLTENVQYLSSVKTEEQLLNNLSESQFFETLSQMTRHE